MNEIDDFDDHSTQNSRSQPKLNTLKRKLDCFSIQFIRVKGFFILKQV